MVVGVVFVGCGVFRFVYECGFVLCWLRVVL